VKPVERQIIGEVFTEQFFTPKELPPEKEPEYSEREASMTPHEREVAKWLRLIGKGTNGSLLVGSRGMITTGTYGENTRLVPVEKMHDYEFPPEVLSRSPGMPKRRRSPTIPKQTSC
jgi:hypothetical protein